MLNAIKKIDKKILIIAGIIILSPILLILFLAIFRGCGNSKLTPEKYEEKMISAAEKYFKDKEPTVESEVKTVKLSTLVKKEYIKSTEDLLDDDSCKGTVSVRLNGSTIEKNDGGFLNYTVNLECKNYKTNTLLSNLMDDVTTVGAGLYQENGYHLYKGEDVKNYIKFYGNDYRIINIDPEGMVKLLKVEVESLDTVWDNKYNVAVNDTIGLNIYADSVILKNMINSYNDPKIISSEAKKHIVSRSVCVDSRDMYNGTIGNYTCSNTLANQVVSLVDVSDFAKASLDANCKSIYDKSCINYNYLKYLNLKTWTPVPASNNTYEVFYLSNGIIKTQDANKYDVYNLVIYIDGNEKLTSGEGKVDKPYVIK